MRKNMGSTDKIIRIIVAVIISVLYFTQSITGTFAIVLLALGGIFLFTSIASFCPLYTLFGINTCSTKNKK